MLATVPSAAETLMARQAEEARGQTQLGRQGYAVVKQLFESAGGRGIRRVEYGEGEDGLEIPKNGESRTQRRVRNRLHGNRVEDETGVEELVFPATVGKSVHVAIERIHLSEEHDELLRQRLRECHVG